MTHTTKVRRFLLLDSRNVEAVSNLKLTVGKVEKHPANPLFVEDKPWEQRFDNLYGNVIFDADEEVYKCWYSPFIVANSARGMSLRERLERPYTGHKQQEMGICYAVSKDGLTWSKPNLGQVVYDGSTNNNIVWRGPHGAGVYKDEREQDSARKYKTIFQGLNVSFSPDGLSWSEPHKIESQSAGDTHNNALWVPSLNKYVAFTRTWTELDRELERKESKSNHRWARQIARLESTDFINWDLTQVIIQGSRWELQTYAISVFEYAGIYLGLIEIHDQISDRVWTELAWSADTTHWERIDEGTPFIGCGDMELAYDYGCVYACVTPVVLVNEIRIYYGGSDWLHFGWRNGCLALATLQPDRFAGFMQEHGNEVGLLRTSLLPYSGEAIKVSADVETGGCVMIRVLDRQGSELATGELKRRVTDFTVIERLPASASEIRIEFRVRAAKIYSFAISGG